MNTFFKATLGCLFGAVLVIAVVVVLALTVLRSTALALLNNVMAEPGEAAQIGQLIAGYTVPAGYTSAVATQFAHLEVVGYNGPDGHHHIYLLQLPPYLTLNQAEIERLLDSNTSDQGSGGVSALQVVEERPVTIRGQGATLVVSEGVNGEGVPIRSANALFTGKDSQALLSFAGPSATWDESVVTAFIESMH
jgi:hypothetical protein